MRSKAGLTAQICPPFFSVLSASVRFRFFYAMVTPSTIKQEEEQQ